MPSPDLWQHAGVAVAVGLLIGAERERAKSSHGSAGVRTFALYAGLGFVATLVPEALGAVLVAAAAGLVAISYWQAQPAERGVTSEAALLVTLGLGALTTEDAGLAAGLAVATTVLLTSKEYLHRFIRQTVTDVELSDALKFFVAAFIVLPLLPSGHLGPYGVWNLQRIWLLVVLITGIGFLGYAATRVLGERRGLLVSGLAGGFVSGTLTTGAMAEKVRSGSASTRAALAGALMASVATLVQLVAITTLAEPTVAELLLPAAVAASLVLLGEVWWLTAHNPDEEPGAVAGGKPFALLPALLLAAVISGVLLLATWMEHRYGASGATLATATGALADLHAASVAVATMAHTGTVTASVAVQAIAVGLVTNTVGKSLAALVAGGPQFAGLFLAAMVPPGVAVAVALVAVA